MPFNPDKYSIQAGFNPLKYSVELEPGLEGADPLMSFLPEPVSSLAVPGTRQEQLPLTAPDIAPVSGIEDLMFQIPRLKEKQFHPRAEGGRVATNLLLGGAELTANMPAFILDIMTKITAAPFDKEARESLKAMPSQIVEPAAKLAAALTVKGESPQATKFAEETFEESKQRPEAPLMPLLIAAGIGKGAVKAGRYAKGKLRPTPKLKAEPVSEPAPPVETEFLESIMKPMEKAPEAPKPKPDILDELLPVEKGRAKPVVRVEPEIIDNRPNLKKGASVEYKAEKTGKIISGKIVGKRPFDEKILVKNQNGIQRIMNVKDLRAAGTPVEDFTRPPSYRKSDYPDLKPKAPPLRGVKPKAEVEKEPYETTKAEYVESSMEKYTGDYPTTKEGFKKYLEKQHLLDIGMAWEEGKIIPQRVLREYPKFKEDYYYAKRSASVEYSAKGISRSEKTRLSNQYDRERILKGEYVPKHIFESALRLYPSLAKKFKKSDYVKFTKVKVETPKEAVKEIIEGKAESNLGIKEFKKQMLAKIDEALKIAPEKEHAPSSKITIQIPRDGEFTIYNDKPTLTELYKKVKNLKESKGVWSEEGGKPPAVVYHGRGYAERGEGYGWRAPKVPGKYKAPTLKEAMAAGDVEFIPTKKPKLASETGAVVNPIAEVSKLTSEMIERAKMPPEIKAGVKEAKTSMIAHDEQIRNGEFIHRKMNKAFNQVVPDKNRQLTIIHAVQQKRNPKYYNQLTPQEKGVVKWMELELDKMKAFNVKYEITDIKQMPEGVRYVPGSWKNPKTGDPYPMMYGKFSRGLPQAKQKKFMTYEEGMSVGAEMATTNLGEIIGGAWESLIRAKNTRDMMKTLYHVGAEKGVKIELVKGKPSKPIRMIESWRLLEGQGLTEGYEWYSHPVLEKPMTFKTPDGIQRTLQGAVGIRKELYPFVRAYIENPKYGMLSELNFVAKTMKLSFSLFHHVSLAMQEIANRRIPFKNIRAGLKHIEELDPTMKILHEQGLDIFRGYEDVGYQKVYFSNLTGIVGQTARGALKYTGVNTMRDFLFKVVQPGMKASFAHDVYLKRLPKALKEGLTEKQWAREVVEMADGHFSGEHWKRSLLETNSWMAKAYFSPEARKFWQSILLSPTWQREHMLIAKNVTKSFMPQKLIEYTSMKPISKTAKAEYRKYAYTAIMMVGAIDLYNLMSTKSMDGESKHIWQNPPGKGFGVRAPWNEPSYTVTGKDGKERTVKGGPAYIRPLKSIYEVAEWGKDPLQKFIYKLSPALSAIGRQFWPGQYRHYEKGWKGYPERVKDAATDLSLPISLSQATQVVKGKKKPIAALLPFIGMPTSKLPAKATKKQYYTAMVKAVLSGQRAEYDRLKKQFESMGYEYKTNDYNKAFQEVKR